MIAKKRGLFLTSILLVASTGLSFSQKGSFFQLPDGKEANRFSLNSRFAFNIGATFSQPSTSAPGPASGGGIDREYDNGFVRVDSSGNANGQTWNWGYTGERTGSQGGSQVDMGNDSIVLDSSSISSASLDGDLLPGFELSYMRYVGQIGGAVWGIEGSFSYLDLGMSSSQSATTVSDYYSVGGITPPLAPYEGSFSGPGPVISDEPYMRDITTGSLKAKLNGRLYGLQLGPFLEFPLYENAAIQLGAGISAVYADTTFDMGGSSASENEWLFGGYIEGNLILPLTDRVGFFGGIQYQPLENQTLQTDSISAKLKTESSIFLSLGLTSTF